MAQVIEAKKDAAARQPPPLRFSGVFHARREPTLLSGRRPKRDAESLASLPVACRASVLIQSVNEDFG
jgi:hypothetical protein